MKHPRTLIREAVAARLIEALPKVDARITPARISIHRTTPLFAGKLPAILIYTRDERMEDQPNADPGLRYRKLELSVEIIASGDAAAEEADVLNVAMFGITARQWRDANPSLKGNIRDYATINELICLSNMENINAVLIDEGVAQGERLLKLNQIAIQQMRVLEGGGARRLLTDDNL